MNKKVCNLMQLASLRRYVLTDGAERGIEVIDCDTGKIRFLLNVSKALDIMQLYHEGQNVSFISRNGFTAREIPFEKRFEGGMLYTVGIDWAGEKAGCDLHGTFHNIPARVISAVCDENGIEVRAEIRDTALFGKNLVMRRTIRADIGGETVSLHDELSNENYRDEEYCLLYHVNVGYPMLDACSTVEADIKYAEPRTKWAAENKETMFVMQEPEDNREETCYCLHLNTPCVKVKNPAIGKTLSLRYSLDTLPQFVEWKSMASGDYVLGIEPTTTMLDEAFHTTTLPAGETVKFDVSVTVERT